MYGNKKNPSLTRNVEIPLSYIMLLRKNIHQGQRIKYSENTLRYGGRSRRILFCPQTQTSAIVCLFTNLRWGLNGEFGPTLRLKYKWLHTDLYLFKMTCYHILLKVKYLKLMRLNDIYENTILEAHLLVYNGGKGVWWKLSHQNYTMHKTYKYRQY